MPLFSLTSSEIEDIQEENTSTSRALIFFKDHPKRLLALLLIGNTFVNIGIAILVEKLLENNLSEGALQQFSERIISFLNISPEYTTQLSTFFYFLIAVICL